MSTLALTRLFHQVPGFLERLTRRFVEFVEGIDEARRMAHRFKVLSQMTEGQLAARGLTRAQIPQAVLDLRVRA